MRTSDRDCSSGGKTGAVPTALRTFVAILLPSDLGALRYVCFEMFYVRLLLDLFVLVVIANCLITKAVFPCMWFDVFLFLPVDWLSIRVVDVIDRSLLLFN